MNYRDLYGFMSSFTIGGDTGLYAGSPTMDLTIAGDTSGLINLSTLPEKDVFSATWDDLGMRVNTFREEPSSALQSFLGFKLGELDFIADTAIGMQELSLALNPGTWPVRAAGYITGIGDPIYQEFNVVRDAEDELMVVAQVGVSQLTGSNPEYVHAGYKAGGTTGYVADAILAVQAGYSGAKALANNGPKILSTVKAWCGLGDDVVLNSSGLSFTERVNQLQSFASEGGVPLTDHAARNIIGRANRGINLEQVIKTYSSGGRYFDPLNNQYVIVLGDIALPLDKAGSGKVVTVLTDLTETYLARLKRL